MAKRIASDYYVEHCTGSREDVSSVLTEIHGKVATLFLSKKFGGTEHERLFYTMCFFCMELVSLR